MALSRYAALLAVQLRTSLTTALTYRWEFVVDGVMGVVWAFTSLLPLWVFQGTSAKLAGWSFAEMVVVVGWFTLLKAVLEGAINPSLIAVVEHIRKGTLDFVLLKPADAQFLVSTAKFDPWKLIDVAAAAAVCVYGFVSLGRWPEPAHVGVALGLLVAAGLVLYAVSILVVSAAFWVVRLDNLVYLLMSVLDFARWPVSIFRGALRFVFTFVIPLALMTTYPAMALLGKLSLSTGALAIVGALAFALAARLVWVRAIAHYTSASS